jgi:hypothetical protein
MNKEEVLTHLKMAKAAHIEWVDKAKALIKGSENKEGSIPVGSGDCKFGMWFDREGQLLNALSNNPIECMKSIDALHKKIHELYLSIFNMHFTQGDTKGFFSKIFKEKRKTLSPQDKELVETQLKNLEDVSQQLLDELSRLERRLVAVSDEKIEALG